MDIKPTYSAQYRKENNMIIICNNFVTCKAQFQLGSSMWNSYKHQYTTVRVQLGFHTDTDTACKDKDTVVYGVVNNKIQSQF